MRSNWLVRTANQQVTRQRLIVEPAAGVVEPPIFADAESSVHAGFDGVVPPASGSRGYFQRELRRLAHQINLVAVVVRDSLRVDAERDDAIGDDDIAASASVEAEITVAVYQYVGPAEATEIRSQYRVGPDNINRLSHIGFLRRVRQRLVISVPAAGKGLSGRFRGHDGPHARQ